MAAVAPAPTSDVVTSEEWILAVDFRSHEGRSWSAIGGGPTVAAAVAFARASCPSDAMWYAVSWTDVYGD